MRPIISLFTPALGLRILIAAAPAALGLLLLPLGLWRASRRFPEQAAIANWSVMAAGFTFMRHQLASYRLA